MGALAPDRLCEIAGGGVKKQKGKLQKAFVPLFIKTMASPAWRSLPHGARSLYLLMKRLYNRKHQGPVYLSERFAAKELGAARNTVAGWLSALITHGFV